MKQAGDILKIRPQEELIILFDEYDLSFYEREAEEAVMLWEAGADLKQITEKLRPVNTNEYRPYQQREIETFLLLLHLACEEKIGDRGTGIFSRKGG